MVAVLPGGTIDFVASVAEEVIDGLAVLEVVVDVFVVVVGKGAVDVCEEDDGVDVPSCGGATAPLTTAPLD